MTNVSYKRGQVEWALWRAFTLHRGREDDPPTIFRTRIKRLLDIDRELDVEGPKPSGPAFGVPPHGKGIEAEYSAFDVFSLGLALDLLDIGFKQGEVVLVVRHLRADLEHWFPHLISRPSLLDRQNHLAKLHPDLPPIERPGRAPLADARVFLILNRIEMTEALLLPGGYDRPHDSVILTPEICVGVAGLENRVQALMPLHRRSLIVVEVAALAQAVAAFLERAPIISRGRPRKLKG